MPSAIDAHIPAFMLTPLFGPFLLMSLLVELTPGPNMAWLALTSASQGRSAGLAAVAGMTLGLATLSAVAALGLAQLAAASPLAFDLLRYAGVAYLLWLAWQAWNGGSEVSPGILRNGAELRAWFRHGLFLNLLNPKAAVFFVTVLPTYVDPVRPIAMQTILLSISYVSIATFIHILFVLLAGRAHGWLTDDVRQRRFRRIFAVLLAAIAIWFLAWN